MSKGIIDFPGAENLQPIAPNFSVEDYAAMGISLGETNQYRLLEVPFKTQKHIVELSKRHGFGASRFLNDAVQDILRKFGFVSGSYKIDVNEKTFAWTATQSKVPKGDAAPARVEPEAARQAAVKDTPVKTFSAVTTPNEEDKVAHKSGATSSHFSPFSFYNRFEGVKLTCQRFLAGNRKHENSTPVYAEMNWLKALASRDVSFFRDRAGHAVEHLIAEMHGNDDDDPGGNLGAVGWFVEIFAYVKKWDPFFYACIQGKCHVDDAEAEAGYEIDKLLENSK